MRITGMTVKKSVITAETHVHLQPVQDPISPQSSAPYCWLWSSLQNCVNVPIKKLSMCVDARYCIKGRRWKDKSLRHEHQVHRYSPSQDVLLQRSEAAAPLHSGGTRRK